jgi:hypothetical protein
MGARRMALGPSAVQAVPARSVRVDLWTASKTTRKASCGHRARREGRRHPVECMQLQSAWCEGDR